MAKNNIQSLFIINKATGAYLFSVNFSIQQIAGHACIKLEYGIWNAFIIESKLL